MNNPLYITGKTRQLFLDMAIAECRFMSHVYNIGNPDFILNIINTRYLKDGIELYFNYNDIRDFTKTMYEAVKND